MAKRVAPVPLALYVLVGCFRNTCSGAPCRSCPDAAVHARYDVHGTDAADGDPVPGGYEVYRRPDLPWATNYGTALTSVTDRAAARRDPGPRNSKSACSAVPQACRDKSTRPGSKGTPTRGGKCAGHRKSTVGDVDRTRGRSADGYGRKTPKTVKTRRTAKCKKRKSLQRNAAGSPEITGAGDDDGDGDDGDNGIYGRVSMMDDNGAGSAVELSDTNKQFVRCLAKMTDLRRIISPYAEDLVIFITGQKTARVDIAVATCVQLIKQLSVLWTIAIFCF
ncbi:Hypothetical protein CINCED_3A022542 [Cinara cedri]|uniref:Uncharacterized protein n=1 Tax=Cinara cedri TaxID=506608 RepID=A0A5E4MEB5_9HEMI|nr:Hypothetical protein CINCED_3A022542 [Cinara cedri]